MTNSRSNRGKREALEFHSKGRPGKIQVVPTKPLTTQRDLSLAYSPGVAEPCMEIFRDPAEVYKYTARGNLVAVITGIFLGPRRVLAAFRAGRRSTSLYALGRSAEAYDVMSVEELRRLASIPAGGVADRSTRKLAWA